MTERKGRRGERRKFVCGRRGFASGLRRQKLGILSLPSYLPATLPFPTLRGERFDGGNLASYLLATSLFPLPCRQRLNNSCRAGEGRKATIRTLRPRMGIEVGEGWVLAWRGRVSRYILVACEPGPLRRRLPFRGAGTTTSRRIASIRVDDSKDMRGGD